MKKRVRCRPKHNSANQAKKGVVYLPKEWVGTVIHVLPESQYKTLMKTIKRLKVKITRVRKVIHEYSST